MSSISKVIIAIPITILILAVMVRFFGVKKKKILPLNTGSLEKTFQKPASQLAKLDLQGPLVCKGTIDRATVNAYIKNKEIFVQREEATKSSNFLVKDNCLYAWEERSSRGEKFCGIQPLLNLIESFPDSLGELMSICRKEEIENNSMFIIPSHVSFKEESFQNLLL